MKSNERIRYISRLSENRFEELCIYSDLSWTPPRRDENGWDALVELPLNDSIAIHRDGQPPALKCLVQMKATDDDPASSIPMAVSNWEKLAKTSLPSFLIIFYFCGNEQPVEIYVCHFDNIRIGKTLRKVRELESEGSLTLIHQRRMLFAPDQSERLQTNLPQALKHAIVERTGLDAAAYAISKDLILKTIGFSSHIHTMKFSANIPPGELSDIFLGRKEMPVQNVIIGSLRFGIELIDRQLSSGIIRITPAPSSKCKIAVSSRLLRTRVLLDAEVYVPACPSIPGQSRKILITSTGITIEATSSVGTFSAQLPDDDLQDFVQLLRKAKFLSMFQQRDAKISVLLPNTELPLHFKAPLSRISYFKETYLRLQIIEKVLQLAGMHENFRLFVSDLYDQDLSMRWFQCIIRKSTIRVDASDLPEDLFVKRRRGFFATAIWFKFYDKFLIIPCIWNSEIQKEGAKLVFVLRRCRVFECFWADNVEKETRHVWPRFEKFCFDEALGAPLMIYGPPVEIDLLQPSATLHIPD